MPRLTAQPPSPEQAQSSLLDIPPKAGTNTAEYTVTELSKALKKTVEETYGMVRVRGEISECKYHSSGHVYITLKDEGASLASVCWKGQITKLSVRPEIGMDVVCTGRLTTYAGQSKYQMVIEGMALAGVGALLKMLEERKRKLAAEGLFDPDRKRMLPFLPTVIGVVTSPTGAVIRDILHRLEDRFPRHVLVWPVAVQGTDAPQQIVRAITGFNQMSVDGAVRRPDVLIVARGGGSVEDLMAFNDESVVRAAAGSVIPIISAVGHETDTTLIDFVADRRAPTPSAAAEMAVPVRELLRSQVADNGERLRMTLRRLGAEYRERLGLVSRAMGDPARAIEPLMQRLDEKSQRLIYISTGFFEKCAGRAGEAASRLRHPRETLQLAAQKLENIVHRQETQWRDLSSRKQSRLDTLSAVLGHLSPRSVLGRGYALVQDSAGNVVMSRKQVGNGERVIIEFNDGTRDATIVGSDN